MLAQADGRKHEKITDKVQGRGGDKERVLGRDTNLTGGAMYSTRPDQQASLFGFQAGGDDDEPRGDRRGGRGGGRGGRDQGAREPRQGGGRRRGGKVVTDDDFPAL